MRYKHCGISETLEMSGFWILILTFSTMDPVKPGGRWVTAQSLTQSPVHQPDEELRVDIGDSATLRCCVFEKDFSLIAWFKQTERKRPQTIVYCYRITGETFYNAFEKPRFQIERSSNCFNLMILNITGSDEAMYYCATSFPSTVFGDGTYLKITETSSETSKPVLCDNSRVCESTLHGNSTNTNTREKTVSEMTSLHWTVLGLGTALGLCVLLIFGLTYIIMKRRKTEMCGLSENCPETRQETETLNYAALKFSKRSTNAETWKTGTSNECVYSCVKKTVT